MDSTQVPNLLSSLEILHGRVADQLDAVVVGVLAFPVRCPDRAERASVAEVDACTDLFRSHATLQQVTDDALHPGLRQSPACDQVRATVGMALHTINGKQRIALEDAGQFVEYRRVLRRDGGAAALVDRQISETCLLTLSRIR